MHLDGQQRALLDALDGLAVMDSSGRIELANRTLQTLLGYTESELCGRTRADVFGQPMSALPDTRERTGFARVRTRSGDALSVRLRVDPLPGGRSLLVVRPAANAELDGMRQEIESAKAEREELTRERDFLRAQLARARGYGPIVGSSAAINLLHAQVAAISRTDSPALISGEPGVGKRLTGYAVHLARHPEEPLVELDFRHIPEDFQSGLLFDERLPVAAQGTLMLVGVEAMGVQTQGELLARMDSLGGTLVATTTVDLRNEVQSGRFLEELYYRLGIHPLRVPPLRRRPHDVALLASHFWGDAIPESVGLALAEQPWPGNVRELRGRIERAKILARKRGVDTLSLDLLGLGRAAPLHALPGGAEPARIRRALREHAGNIQRSAHALGMSRQSLYRRIQKHGIER